MTKKAYNVNTTARCVKQLKVIMGTAESEGLHVNNVWKDKRFKGTFIDVDSIYLTREDLEKIQEADLSLSTMYSSRRFPSSQPGQEQKSATSGRWIIGSLLMRRRARSRSRSIR